MANKKLEGKKKLVFDGTLYQIWHVPVVTDQGTELMHEYAERKYAGASAVLLDNDQNIFLVKEFRTALGADVVSLPAGKFFAAKESPEEAIVRELREEIKLRPRHVELLFEAHGDGSWRSDEYGFFCTDPVADPLPGDSDEQLEIIHIPFREYLGQVMNAKTYQRYSDYRAVIMVARKLGLIEIKS